MDGWMNRYGTESENPNALAGFAHRLFSSVSNTLNSKASSLLFFT